MNEYKGFSVISLRYEYPVRLLHKAILPFTAIIFPASFKQRGERCFPRMENDKIKLSSLCVGLFPSQTRFIFASNVDTTNALCNIGDAR